MATFLDTPTDFQDTPEWRQKIVNIELAYAALYPGSELSITQSDPIQESVDGKTGCTWNAASPQLPNAGTFPIGFNDERTPGQIAVVINETLVTAQYWSVQDAAAIAAGQPVPDHVIQGAQPYTWPKPQWKNLPDDGGDPDQT